MLHVSNFMDCELELVHILSVTREEKLKCRMFNIIIIFQQDTDS